MQKDIFSTRHIDDDAFWDPSNLKYCSYEVESKFYPYIGELVSEFNSLEDSLDDDLVDYIGNDTMPNAAEIIISTMTFGQKWKLWVDILLNYFSEDFYEITDSESEKLVQYKAKVSEFGKIFERFGKIRNAVVHGMWVYMDEHGLIKTKTKTNAKKQLIHEHVKVNIDDFEILIDEIGQFEDAFLEFNEEIRSQLG